MPAFAGLMDPPGVGWLRMRGLGLRLACLPLIGALPLVGLLLVQAAQQGALLERDAGVEVERAAQAAALSQDLALKRLPDMLQTMAALEEGAGGDRLRCDRALAVAVSGNPLIRTARVFAADGSLVCHSLGIHAPGSFREMANFRGPVAKPGLHLGEPAISPATGEVTLVVGIAIRDPVEEGSELRRVVNATIDPTFFPLAVAGAVEIKPSEGRSIVVLHRSGKLLGQMPSLAPGPGQAEVAASMVVKGTGVLRGIGFDGLERITGLATVGSLGLVIGISVPLEPIAARGRALLLNGLVVGLLAVATGLFAASAAARLLVRRPVERLVRATASVARGDFQATGRIGRLPGELDRAGRALVAMSQELARSAAEAERNHAVLLTQATTDPLTGLANRRAFDGALAAGFDASRRSGQPVALLLVDVDHFKLFNDALGHAAGDESLQRIGRVLAGALRADTDLAARIGGEEFVVLLLGAGLDEGGGVADRLRSAVAQAAILHPRAPTGLLTVSIGLAAGPASEFPSAEAMLAAADRALYAAKRGGRDRWVAAPGGLADDPGGSRPARQRSLLGSAYMPTRR